jgi:hypothetical protein
MTVLGAISEKGPTVVDELSSISTCFWFHKDSRRRSLAYNP